MISKNQVIPKNTKEVSYYLFEWECIMFVHSLLFLFTFMVWGQHQNITLRLSDRSDDFDNGHVFVLPIRGCFMVLSQCNCNQIKL